MSHEPKSAGNKKRLIHPAYLLTGLNRSDSTPTARRERIPAISPCPNTTMASVSFFDQEDESSLWTTEGPAPCVGDSVMYEMSRQCDQSQWDPEAWEERMEISRKKWVVTKVEHDFQQYSPFKLSHIIYVFLAPVADS